jgi:hypothetical protein
MVHCTRCDLSYGELSSAAAYMKYTDNSESVRTYINFPIFAAVSWRCGDIIAIFRFYLFAN